MLNQKPKSVLDASAVLDMPFSNNMQNCRPVRSDITENRLSEPEKQQQENVLDMEVKGKPLLH